MPGRWSARSRTPVLESAARRDIQTLAYLAELDCETVIRAIQHLCLS